MVAEQTAHSTLQVFQAGRDLREALGDPARAALAAERLASTAETSIAELDQLGTERMVGIASAPDDAEQLLAATLSQLGVAGTMFAASEAVGEHGAAQPTALDEPLRELDATVALLNEPRPFAAAGIGAMAASATVADAVAALRRQVDRTVDDVVARSTKVIGGSFTGIRDRGPAEVRKAWDMINEKLHLDKIGGKLAAIGLRAFRSALELLARIVPAHWLTGIRAAVDRLIISVDEHGPGKTLVAAAIGADLVTAPRPDQSGLDTARLDRGTAELAELTAKYGKLMELAGGIGTAIGLAVKLTAVVRIAVPQLAVLIAAAHLLVIGSVVVLGRDHLDAGPAPAPDGDGETDDTRGMVRGARTIVAEATA